MSKSYKDIITNDFLEVNKKFIKEKPNKTITRNYYRKYKDSKITDSLIEEYFGSFTELKKCNIVEEKKVLREDIDVVKTNKKVNKRYVVSSIITGAKVNEKFYESLVTYCNHNNSELILLVMRGINNKDSFSEEDYNKYSKHFVTEFTFNKNLVAMDFMLSPQMILPLTGLNRFGGKDKSVIVAHTKQMLNSIARKKDDFPHLVVSTGTVCEPNYRNTRQGRLASQDNSLSALIVEVESNEIFHIRQIQFDGKGFYDITNCVKFYEPNNKIKNDSAEAIVYEPHIGQENKDAVKFTKDLLKIAKSNKVFIHDSFDGRSCNPHENKNIKAKHLRPEHQKTLQQELNYFASYLLEWEQEFKNIKFYHVYSNHNLFLNRYLESGNFVFDSFNARTGAELFIDLLDNKNPLESYIKKNFNIKRNYFLKEDESFLLKGCEMNTHGHKGSNGSRGSVKNIELTLNNAFIGHTHSPTIHRNTFQVGCVCDLQQE